MDTLPVAFAECAISARRRIFKPIIEKYPPLKNYQLIRLILFVRFLRDIGKNTGFKSIQLYICKYAKEVDYVEHVRILEELGLFTVIRLGASRRIRSVYLTNEGLKVLHDLNKCYLDYVTLTKQRKQRKECIYLNKRKKQ